MGCSDKNNLIREGTGQHERFLRALSPAYARVDERDLRQLLLFARRYADQVAYFNRDNAPDGTWMPLIQRDASVVLAALATLDTVVYADYHKLLISRIRQAVAGHNEVDARQCFKYLFDSVFTLAKAVDEQCALLHDYADYQREIAGIIALRLDTAVRSIRTLREAVSDLLIPVPGTDASAPFVPVDTAVSLPVFSYISNDPVAFTLTIPAGTPLASINYVVHHNLFQQQLKAILTGAVMAVRKANALFEASLTADSRHQPHMALLHAFLKLFGHAQEQLNEYGQRHLDYYYKEVLRFHPKGPEPDSAHLTFELHKHAESHLLKAGTLFKGGKDDVGHSLFYRLTDDLVLNQARVGALHAFRKTGQWLYVSENVDQAGTFLFGEAETPARTLGFALASRLLYLEGGERTITVTLQFNRAMGVLRKSAHGTEVVFTTALTGEQGWIENRVNAVYDARLGKLSFTVTLDGSQDAVRAYDEKIHGKRMDVSLPVLAVYMDQELSGVAYDQLAGQPLTGVQVDVDVKGYRTAVLSNDIGRVDGSKPFKPFGDLPRRGAGFYIGSDELFRKPLTALTLVTDLPAEFTADYLSQGKWKSVKVERTAEGYTLNIPRQPIRPVFSRKLMPVYGTGTRDGFVRLVLNTDRYSLSAFMDSLTQSFNETKLVKIPAQAVSEQKAPVYKVVSELSQQELLSAALAPAQYAGFQLVKNSTPTPKELIVNRLELDYSATDTVTFGPDDEPMFFHCYPFGVKRITRVKRTGMLPIFEHSGELFIGLEGIQPPKTVTLLVEVLEGSANPLKQMEPVQWYYLDRNDEWKQLEKAALADGTRNLTRTGIVTVSLPADAAFNAATMPPARCWIKLAVSDHLDAVCRLIGIRAQAGRVELVQDIENGIYFRRPLPQGTIAKLVAGDAAVKKIEQPSASFGGRPQESSDQFYTRVSERLRHKQRAVTMWDYERLVLEQFPSIYQVKCINRAGFIEKAGELVFCENYPGHVTLITVPDLSNISHPNPLRPYTPIGTLVAIADYLQAYNNPFVKLHVRNPQFEEIQLEFSVVFRPQLDETYYLNRLNDEIERFLCPWAFDHSKPIPFGSRVRKSALIDFIDELPYVDVVSDFKMHHFIRDEQYMVREAYRDVEEIVATSARSILVSYADGSTRHRIRVTPNCACV